MALDIREELVLQQRYEALHMVAGARDSLDQRATSLLQGSSLVLVLVSLIRLPDLVTQPGLVAKAGVLIALLAFAGMVGCYLSIIWPRVFELPGSQNWESIDLKRLQVSTEDSYLQVLSDTMTTIDKLMKTNEHKARLLQASVVLFAIQMVGLIGLALAA